jgi:CubicO group peptidase (beta-lactamase class C family)
MASLDVRSSALEVRTDPGEVGLDPRRLQRVDRRLQRFVDEGSLPGFLVTVSRHGERVHVARGGSRDVERGLPVEDGTRWRIYSMTKPLTSVAAMMLYEDGAFELNDPVARYLPEFAQTRVYQAGTPLQPVTVPQTEPMRVAHLLTHTSGLTYGFNRVHPVDAMYRAAGHEWTTPPGLDAAAVCQQWAALPLVFQPGSEWNYGVSTDVLGHLVEVLSGQTLDQFFAERILGPLAMGDTGFWLPSESDPADLARLYLATAPERPGGATGFTPIDDMGAAALRRPAFLSGGGGLVSTATDYLRFAEMLRRGGTVDPGADVEDPAAERLLGPRTLAHMVRNHLPGGSDIAGYGRPVFAETPQRGVGFGLGFSMVIDPVAYGVLASRGDYGWGGAASTGFWVDPVEDVVVTLYAQLLPSSTLPLRTYLRQLVNQALVTPAAGGRHIA